MDYSVVDYIANSISVPTINERIRLNERPISLTKLADIPLLRGTNQCQGFCYNSRKDVFVMACINANNTKQVIYEIDPISFAIKATYEYSYTSLLGHMNTLTYNPSTNRYYTTNAVVDGYIVTPIEASSMVVEQPIKLKEKVFNFAYDKQLHRYVSIVPYSNSIRTINYYDSNFKLIRTIQVDAQHYDLNNNGAYAYNGNTLFTTLTTFVFVDANGHIQSIRPYPSGMEVEDMDYRNGQLYVAVNRNGKVELYGVPTVSFSVNA